MGLCVKVLRDIHSYCVLCYGSVCEGTGLNALRLCIVLSHRCQCSAEPWKSTLHQNARVYTRTQAYHKVKVRVVMKSQPCEGRGGPNTDTIQMSPEYELWSKFSQACPDQWEDGEC